jgi:hypothetical protein
MAITNLAAWMGITVTPLQLLSQNDFSSYSIIYAGLVLGVLLIAAAFFSNQQHFKAHFAFTYSNFGTHVFLIANLAAMFAGYETNYFLWFLVLGGAVWFFYTQALKQRSFYFLMIITLYAYVGLSFMIVRLLMYSNNSDGLLVGLMYFIASGIGLVLLLIHFNKKLKKA